MEILTTQSRRLPIYFFQLSYRSVFNDDFSGGRKVKKFTPKVDIADTDKSFEIQLQLPGIPKSNRYRHRKKSNHRKWRT